MTEREDGGLISCKKFKSSHQRNEFHSRVHKAPEGEAGNYFLGPVLRESVTTPVTQCLARRKGTDDYYLMKILPLDDSNFSDKCTFHNEYSILSLLKGHPGVIQLCDFFKDYGLVEDENSKRNPKRICMVLECLIPHGHHNQELIPLSLYLKEGRLSETESLYIFYNLLLVLEDLHSRNIVHRDLKFSSIILNRKSLKVKLMNFQHSELLSSSDRSGFQKSAQCRTRRICDMCSAGVVLHGMLNGSVSGGDHSFSSSNCVSDGTKELLMKIQFRLEASQALDMVSTLLAVQCSSQNPNLLLQSRNSDQVVPTCPGFDSKEPQECSSSPKRKSSPVVSEISSPESEISVCDKQKGQKLMKMGTDGSHRPQTIPLDPKSPPQSALLGRKEIKHAMMRLGVTSVNSINALSFNYSKKNTCRS